MTVYDTTSATELCTVTSRARCQGLSTIPRVTFCIQFKVTIPCTINASLVCALASDRSAPDESCAGLREETAVQRYRSWTESSISLNRRSWRWRSCAEVKMGRSHDATAGESRGCDSSSEHRGITRSVHRPGCSWWIRYSYQLWCYGDPSRKPIGDPRPHGSGLMVGGKWDRRSGELTGV